MKHYRRKPLPLIDQVLPESVANLLTSVETLPTISPQSVELPTASEPIAESISEVMNPIVGGTEPMPSPDALVQQAASILEGDLSAPLKSAQTVTSPLDLGTRTSSSPSSYSVPGLVSEMHDFVNELANLISCKSDLIGDEQEPAISSDTSVPLLHPPHPIHAGERVQFSFKVHNDSAETAQVKFFCTDLYRCEGDPLPRHAISIAPHTLSLAPDAIDSIMISIQLPQNLANGEYAGLLMVSGLSDLKAVISLVITSIELVENEK